MTVKLPHNLIHSILLKLAWNGRENYIPILNLVEDKFRKPKISEWVLNLGSLACLLKPVVNVNLNKHNCN